MFSSFLFQCYVIFSVYEPFNEENALFSRLLRLVSKDIGVREMVSNLTLTTELTKTLLLDIFTCRGVRDLLTGFRLNDCIY
jgi:hypothetical protein